MKSKIVSALLLFFVMTATAHAGVNIGINLGIPVPLPPGIVIRTAPEFIYQPQLGFHVSVGAPYDVIYLGNFYYLYNNGYYYRSKHYNGPWVGVEYRKLPLGLRKHRFEDIRRYRDVEYRRYNDNREHYRGSWHRPGERRYDERRYDGKRGYEERRKEHRQYEVRKDDRRDHYERDRGPRGHEERERGWEHRGEGRR